MTFLEGFALVWVGMFLGFLVASLLQASRDEDELNRKVFSPPILGQITEACPHCGTENTLEWDIKKSGYKAYCPHCGEPMMLCDECLHADDNKPQKCDWCKSGCFREKNNENQENRC